MNERIAKEIENAVITMRYIRFAMEDIVDANDKAVMERSLDDVIRKMDALHDVMAYGGIRFGPAAPGNPLSSQALRVRARLADLLDTTTTKRENDMESNQPHEDLAKIAGSLDDTLKRVNDLLTRTPIGTEKVPHIHTGTGDSTVRFEDHRLDCVEENLAAVEERIATLQREPEHPTAPTDMVATQMNDGVVKVQYMLGGRRHTIFLASDETSNDDADVRAENAHAVNESIKEMRTAIDEVATLLRQHIERPKDLIDVKAATVVVNENDSEYHVVVPFDDPAFADRGGAVHPVVIKGLLFDASRGLLEEPPF